MTVTSAEKQSQGWIKLHRQLRDKGYYQKSDYVHLWIECLLRANHKAREVLWNGKTTTIKPGQFITGRRKLASETGISESRVHRILKHLENAQQIEQQTSNTSRLISITNWEEYQSDEQQNEQRVNNERTTSEQRVNTNKNDKNDDNEKNDNIYRTKRFVKPDAAEVTEYAASIDFPLDGTGFVDFYESKGWLIGKNPMRDWKAAVRTWKKKNYERGCYGRKIKQDREEFDEEIRPKIV
jgi:DNA-binding transcriptional regulator YhcF (GntR family)